MRSGELPLLRSFWSLPQMRFRLLTRLKSVHEDSLWLAQLRNLQARVSLLRRLRLRVRLQRVE